MRLLTDYFHNSVIQPVLDKDPTIAIKIYFLGRLVVNPTIGYRGLCDIHTNLTYDELAVYLEPTPLTLLTEIIQYDTNSAFFDLSDYPDLKTKLLVLNKQLPHFMDFSSNEREAKSNRTS